MALDINSASVEELAALPEVDAELAASIVEYRGQNGDFTSLDELREVPGFTQETVARLEEAGVVVGVGAQAEAGGEGPQM